MNITFNESKNFGELEVLAPGQCFIPKSKKPQKGEKIVWMKLELADEDEDPGEDILCARLTGDDPGYTKYFDRKYLVIQIDFELVECK